MGQSDSKKEVSSEETNQNKFSDIVLLGDSTLDNVVWVNGQEECIAYKLRQKNPGKKIYNLAADGFNSQNMLTGASPSISWDARRKGNDPFLIQDYRANPMTWTDPKFFKPLDQISQIPKVELENAICVCSFGGNDIREALGSIAFGKDPREILQVTLKNYFEFLSHLLPRCKKVVLCTQYFPNQNEDVYRIYEIFRLEGVKELMRNIYPPLLEFAKEKNLAIADFANTFDSTNSKLYKAQIEPSSLGGDLIVEIIDYVAKNHTFEKSLIYSLNSAGKIQVKENDGSWNV